MTRGTRALAVVALGLLVLLGVQLAEASFHSHSAMDECAPCRLLSVCRGFDLPTVAAVMASVALLARVLAPDADLHPAFVPVASGRAPPAA